MSLLNTLSKIVAKSKKRIGRGYGSGVGGHTSTRGQKGYKSRQGSKVPLWFEGGQLPLIKRLPMLRGKGKLNVVRPTAEVSLKDLEKMKATEISLETLKLEKVIDSKFSKAKIIRGGTLTRKVVITGIPASKQAKAYIEQLGGQVN